MNGPNIDNALTKLNNRAIFAEGHRDELLEALAKATRAIDANTDTKRRLVKDLQTIHANITNSL